MFMESCISITDGTFMLTCIKKKKTARKFNFWMHILKILNNCTVVQLCSALQAGT